VPVTIAALWIDVGQPNSERAEHDGADEREGDAHSQQVESHGDIHADLLCLTGRKLTDRIDAPKE
jgi:hypothetical protein